MNNINDAPLADDFYIVAPFTCYAPIPGTQMARITGAGQQPLGGTRVMAESGVNIAAIELVPASAASSPGSIMNAVHEAMAINYVDLSSGAPVIKPRPVFEGAFDKTTVAVKQEATLPGVPTCTVSFSGPVSGTQDHTDGDLAIGFTMPGTYTISFEAFPYQPVSYTLTVTAVPTVTASASVQA